MVVLLMNTFMRDLRLAVCGIKNYITNSPLCASFEITYRCNALCQHCHLHHVQDKELASPEHYAEICHRLKPVVAQISGGEPLLRRDLLDIIRKIKNSNGTPFIVLTTNGVLLTKEKYEQLIDAGVDEISLSLDYPDKRHDDFRSVPGLFNKIVNLLSDLGAKNGKAITVSCVVQRNNYKDLIGIAEFAHKWGINANFSTYTWLRTNDKSLSIPKDEIFLLKEIIEQLISYKKKYKNIRASDYVLRKIPEFFENENIGDCRAGERFLIINPDGTMSPCGLVLGEYRSKKELHKKFSNNNTCGDCYTSIRANTEKPWYYHIKDNINFFQ